MNRRKSLLIWLAMLWAIVMYYVVMRTVARPAAQADTSLATALLAVAVALVVVSILIKQHFLIAVILCDAASVLGLVCWFMTGSPRSYYALVAGILGMLVHFPGKGESRQ